MKTIRKLIVLLLVAAMSLSCFPMAALATEVEEVPQVEIVPEEPVLEAVTAEETEPVAEETEPIIEEAAPVIEETEPVTEETEPVIEETEPVTEETEPVIKDTEPVTEETEPVIEETEPVTEETEPVVEETEPVTEETEPVIEETELVAEEADPVIEEAELTITEQTVSTSAIAEALTTADGFLYEIANGETVTITGYTGTTAELIIPSEIDGKPVVAIAEKAFFNNTVITSVVIPGSVKHIGSSAFSGSNRIKSISLQEGLETIGEYAFACTIIKDIFLPGSLKSIGENAFWQCNSLANVYITDISHYLGLQTTNNFAHLYLNGELITELVVPADITSLPDYAFSGCTGITSVVLPEGLEVIGKYAFSDCKSLTSIVIPSSIKSIGHAAFSSCYKLQKVYLPNVETWFQVSLEGNYASPLSVGSSKKEVYFGGKLLTELTIPQEITAIPDYAFRSCRDLQKLVISNGVTSIGNYAFEGTGITELVIPEGVVSIGDYAFRTCSALTSIAIPDSLESVGSYAFDYCTKLTDIYVSDITEWLTIKWSQNNSLMLANTLNKNIFEDGEPITDVVLPEGIQGIPKKSFSHVKSLTSIYIPDSVKGIGDGAFEYCTNLEAVSIGFSVSSIGVEAFNQCINLNSLFMPETVENVFGRAFKGCNNLTCIVYSGTEQQLQDMSVFTGNDILYEASWHIEGSCCAPTVQIKIDPNTKRPVLTWDDAPCVLAWAVYRSTSASKGYELVDIAYDTSFTDTTDAGGKKYYYIVGGISLAGELGSSSKYKAVTIPCASPVLSVSNSSSGYPTIKWKKVSGAKKYEVYYSTSVDGSYTKLTTTTSTSYTHSKASYGQKYYYKVKVLGSSSSLNSLLSEPVSAMRILARPALSVTVNSSSGKPSLSWKEISGAVSYDIYRAESKNGEFTKLANQTGVTYTDTTAKPDTDYWYKVMALGVTEDRNSAYSTVQKVHATLAKPKVTFSNNSKGKPTLSWKEVDGAVSYRIYRSSYSTKSYKLLKTVKTTEYTDTSVSVGKGYYYKVIAVGADCKSAYSSYKKLYGKCAAPSITVAASTSSGKPVVKWSKVTGAKKYTVYRATSENGKYTAVKTTTSTSYTDTAATVGKTYFYKVKAIHKTSTYNSAYSTIKSCLTVCAKPVVSVKISSTTGKPTLSWKAISGAVSYEIYRAGADGQYTLLKTQNAVKYTDKDAQPDTDYRYKVKAIGSEAELNSAYSTVKKVHTTLAKPKVTFSNNSKGKPKLTWNAVDGAVSYRIYRSSYSTKSYKLLKTVKTTEYTDTSVKVGKGYYYKVIAIGENCKSAYSSYKKLYGKCATPVITVAAKSTTGKPVIKWKKISGAAKYTVYRATEENGTYKALKTTSSLSYTDNSAKLGTTYYYKVKAVHKSSTYSSSNSSYALFECVYVVNTNTGKFHYSHCSSADDIYEENRLEFRGDRDDLVNQGYVPCKNCNP